MKKNQDNQDSSKWGGKRENSGRKQGSTQIISKKEIIESLNYSIEDYKEILKKMLESKDFKKVAFAWEQIFGKAPYSMDVTTGGESFLELFLNARQDSNKKKDTSMEE